MESVLLMGTLDRLKTRYSRDGQKMQYNPAKDQSIFDSGIRVVKCRAQAYDWLLNI